MENDITTGETLAVLGAAAAIGGLGFFLWRRSQKTAPLTMLNTDQLALLPTEEEKIILAQQKEEEIILAELPEPEEEKIILAKLSLREQRRKAGGIIVL